MLADRLTCLDAGSRRPAARGRPYVIGAGEIEPAADTIFRRDEELIVVFLVYNPSVTPDKHFDLEVEYHFFRKSSRRPEGPGSRRRSGRRRVTGERYFNRTEPQRFNPAFLGPQFDPAAGQPVMAGQGVPLAGFPEGDYRLAIKVTDLVSGQSISSAR